MSNQTLKLTNMTSTEVFKLQAQNIYTMLRHNNDNTTGNVQFMPTHLGGALGQNEILETRSIMRQTRVTQ